METKFRHEMKYLISQGQLVLLQQRLKGLIQLDPHVGEAGFYNIRSLYFDDYYNRCYYENLAGTDPREKYRIRIYNQSTQRITLECKRKERGKTLKTVCPLTEVQCRQIMTGTPLAITPDCPPVLAKFTREMMIHKLHPVVIVEYNRVPYVCRLGNVRITLDTHLSSSNDCTGFLDGGYTKRPVMPSGMHLLEVKYDEYLPDYIYRALQLDSLSMTAFSKYFLCRKYTL